MTCPVTGQAQTELVRGNSETTLSIGWRLLADIAPTPLHSCRPGLYNPPHAVPDEFGRLLTAHAGDDNEVVAGVLAAVDASRNELCDVCGGSRRPDHRRRRPGRTLQHEPLQRGMRFSVAEPWEKLLPWDDSGV